MKSKMGTVNPKQNTAVDQKKEPASGKLLSLQTGFIIACLFERVKIISTHLPLHVDLYVDVSARYGPSQCSKSAAGMCHIAFIKVMP